MKVTQGQKAPDFNVKDIAGSPVSLVNYRGHKIHLVFYRFSGCPYCNLRFHQIDKLTELYKKNNVTLISVYESSAKNMNDMMAGEHFYSVMIPNEDSSLYSLYDLDRSMFKLMRYLFLKGGIFDVLKGNKLFKKKVAMDGHNDRLEAEFLINEKGEVVNAHYSKIQGDFLPLETIKSFIGK